MLGEVGSLLIGLSLAVSLYATLGTLWGLSRSDKRWIQSAQNASYTVAAMLGLALLLLLVAFLTNHFEIRYVAQHSSTLIPIYLKMSAVWAGQEGSLLLWSFLQALFAALALGCPTEKARPLVPWAMVFLNLITAFFIAVTLLLSNPFASLPQPPLEGQGLNPVLRHPGMIFHPPALYVGYVGLAVPFAFALAALVTRRMKDWTRALRTWILIAWLGLGLGLLLGMRWAYDVLGWGGYWGWDPVENAGLLPWFTATALLHGAVMQDEKRGFRVWNFMLALTSFILVLFGTFATRSGMIQSVHAYARSNLGAYFLTAIVITLVGSLTLLFTRHKVLTSTASASPASTPFLSRDGMFFLAIILLCTLTVSVFVGSVLPTITEALSGKRFEAGPAWFDRVTGPQFAALVFVIGLCPLLGRAASILKRLRQYAWLIILGAVLVPVIAALVGFTKPVSWIGFGVVGLAGFTTLAEFVEGVNGRCKRTGDAPLNALWRLLRQQRRKYGGYLVHLGVILMAVGVIGTRLYPFERELVFSAGQPEPLGEYTLVFEGLKRDFVDDYVSTWATVSVYKNENFLATLEPRLNQYSADQTLTVPALRPGLREDLYLILSGWSESGDTATFKVVLNVLINFLWLGGLVFLAGGALALWPPLENRVVNSIALIAGLLLLVGAGWAMWGMSHGVATTGNAGRPLVGQPAPDFRIPLLNDATASEATFSLSEQRGKIVLVNFWASWCPPCQDEMPDLQASWEVFEDQDAVFIGVAYQEQANTVLDALTEFGTTYPVGLDAGDRIAQSYGITGVPETFIIDQEGRVAYVHIGPVTAAVLTTELNALR